jgi:hypothetical protein
VCIRRSTYRSHTISPSPTATSVVAISLVEVVCPDDQTDDQRYTGRRQEHSAHAESSRAPWDGGEGCRDHHKKTMGELEEVRVAGW